MSTASPDASNPKPIADPQVFNSTERFAEGWYWAVPSRDLKPGKVAPVVIQGRNLAVYRDVEGELVALDAYCPHMGAHFAEGIVEGKGIRCFFHNWKFGADGQCEDVPSLGRPVKACVKTWPVTEKYGMVWIWTGDEPATPVPFEEEFRDWEAYDTSFGKSWVKGCHPAVVMVNAIDAHHFNTVHNLPCEIVFRTDVVDHDAITFSNTTRGGEDSLFVKLIRPLYKDAIHYKLCYWYGSTGIVTVGPDFFHFHIMFTSRLIEDGKAEGRTILITRKRAGPLGWLFNRAVLFVTKLVGDYFAKGDTQVFSTIKFSIKTPVGPDRSILDFVQHVEGLPAREFGTWEQVERSPKLESVPDEGSDSAVA